MLVAKRNTNVTCGRLEKRLFANGFWLILVLILTAVQNPAVAGKVVLTKMSVAAQVDMTSMAPTVMQTQFPDSTKEIWASAYLENAPDGTSIAAKWYLSSNGQTSKLVENQVQADGSRYIAFRIQPGEQGKLPVGDYRIDFFLNGKKTGSRDFKVTSAVTPPTAAKSVTCSAPENDEKLVLQLAAEHPEAKAQLAELKLMRYSDPKNRFSLIVPGGWFQSEQNSPDQALFLSQNQENDPIAWFVVSVYNVNLSPQFGALDAVNQLTEMLVNEGQKHSAEVVPNDAAAPEKLGANMASGNLLMAYKSQGGKQISQLHSFLVDGQYAFDIQLNAEKSTLNTALFLLQLATKSIWTEPLCGAGN